MTTWTITSRVDAPSSLHDPALHDLALDEVSGRSAIWCDANRAGLVLGSAQRAEVVDRAACAHHDVDIVRRRSGGGAVLIIPGEMLWLDVVIARSDPLWDVDIGRAMWWLGEVWAAALRSCGVERVDVHRGPVVPTPWSNLVCFDGLGSGEVVIDGRKAVGISQRRTRDWARLQSSVHLDWQPELMVQLFVPPRPTATGLQAPYVFRSAPGLLRSAVERHLG